MPNSWVRLKQLNKPEVSGYILEVVGEYLNTGSITGTATNTGQLTGEFYPRHSNPSGYISSVESDTFVTYPYLSGNNTNILTQVDNGYYPRSNPSGFLVSGQVVSGMMAQTGFAFNSNGQYTGFVLWANTQELPFLKFDGAQNLFQIKSLNNTGIINLSPGISGRSIISGFDLFVSKINNEPYLSSGYITGNFMKSAYFNGASGLILDYLSLQDVIRGGVFHFKTGTSENYYLLGKRLGFPSENIVMDMYGLTNSLYGISSNRPFVLGFNVYAQELYSSGYRAVTTLDFANSGYVTFVQLTGASGALSDAINQVTTNLAITGNYLLNRFTGLENSGNVKTTGNQTITGIKRFTSSVEFSGVDGLSGIQNINSTYWKLTSSGLTIGNTGGYQVIINPNNSTGVFLVKDSTIGYTGPSLGVGFRYDGGGFLSRGKIAFDDEGNTVITAGQVRFAGTTAMVTAGGIFSGNGSLLTNLNTGQLTGVLVQQSDLNNIRLVLYNTGAGTNPLVFTSSAFYLTNQSGTSKINLYDASPYISGFTFKNCIISGYVATTGNQTIAGIKTFTNNIYVSNISNTGNVAGISVVLGILSDPDSLASINWSGRQLLDYSEQEKLNWNSGILVGNWTLSGYNLITQAQTGLFVSTGQSGNFYPRYSNPSNYITAAEAGGVTSINGLSGILTVTGAGQVISTLVGSTFTFSGTTSGLVTTGVTGQFAMASKTGIFINTGQTGQFAIASKTGVFITTSQTGQFARSGSYITGAGTTGYYNLTGILRISGQGTITITTGNVASGQMGLIISGGVPNTGSFITTGQTGQFYSILNPAQFIRSGDVAATYVSGTKTGAFVETGRTGILADRRYVSTGYVAVIGNTSISGTKTFLGTVVTTNIAAKSTITSPTAQIHFAPSYTGPNTAPMKFNSGWLMTTPESGAVEYDGQFLYLTDGTGVRDKFLTSGTGLNLFALNTKTGGFVESSKTGSFVESGKTGSFVENFKTGAFVVSGKTGSFVESSKTGAFVENSETGSFITSSLTGSFITSGQTGQFYPISNPAQFTNSGNISGLVENWKISNRGNAVSNSAMIGGSPGIYNSGGAMPSSWIYANAAGLGQIYAILGQTGFESGYNTLDIRFSGVATYDSTIIVYYLYATQPASTHSGQYWTTNFDARLISGTGIILTPGIVERNSSFTSLGSINGPSVSLINSGYLTLTATSKMTQPTVAYFAPVIYSYYASGVTVDASIRLRKISARQTSWESDYIVTSGIPIYATTGQIVFVSMTGEFYPRSGNPSGFVMGSQTGVFVTTSQTGAYYPINNPASFIRSGDVTTTYALNTKTGDFVEDTKTGSFVEISKLITGSVITTGNQTISGVKTFVSMLHIKTPVDYTGPDAALIKFNSGVLISPPYESGTVEYDGYHLWLTDGTGVRNAIMTSGDITGQFYPISNPASFIRSGDVTTTYALNTKTGNFVEDSDTGKFADASLSTYYALNTKTGAFITSSQTGNFIEQNRTGILSGLILTTGLRMQGPLTTNFNSSLIEAHNNVAFYANNSGGTTAFTGIIKLTMPFSWTTSMMSLELDGFVHDYSGAWKLLLGGTNHATTIPAQWFYCDAKSLGTLPFSGVRFGHDGTNCCVLLGFTGTVWQYPKIILSRVLLGQSNFLNRATGWSFSPITDDSSITGIVTGRLNYLSQADTLDGYHASSFAFASQTGSFITSNQTGAYYPINNPAQFIRSGDVTTTYALNTKTGSFVESSKTGYLERDLYFNSYLSSTGTLSSWWYRIAMSPWSDSGRGAAWVSVGGEGGFTVPGTHVFYISKDWTTGAAISLLHQTNNRFIKARIVLNSVNAFSAFDIFATNTDTGSTPSMFCLVKNDDSFHHSSYKWSGCPWSGYTSLPANEMIMTELDISNNAGLGFAYGMNTGIFKADIFGIQTSNINMTGGIYGATNTGAFVENSDTGKFADASLSTYYTLNTKTGNFVEQNKNANLSGLLTSGLQIRGPTTVDLDQNVSIVRYKDVATFVGDYSGAPTPQTGTLKLRLPFSWSETMLYLEIDGYSYNASASYPTTGAWKLLLGGFCASSTNSWFQYSAKSLGSIPFSGVRFAHDGTNNCILLGQTGTVWWYPKIFLSQITMGYLNFRNKSTGYNFTLVTDESNITGQKTGILNEYSNSDLLDGYHASSFTLASQTGSFITSSQTGQFYPITNPASFIRSGDVTTTYALNTKTGNFVEDSDTGKFADASLSTYYALNTKTGSFVTSLSTGGFVTTGQTGNFVPASVGTGYFDRYYYPVKGIIDNWRLSNIGNAVPNSALKGTNTPGIYGSGGAMPYGWSYAYGNPTQVTGIVGNTGVESGYEYIDFRLSGRPNIVSAGGVYAAFNTARFSPASVGDIWLGSCEARLLSGTGITLSVLITERNSADSSLNSTYGSTITLLSSDTGYQTSSGVRTFTEATVAYPGLQFFHQNTANVTVDASFRIRKPSLRLISWENDYVSTTGTGIRPTTGEIVFASMTGGFITTGQSGQFYPITNPASFIRSGDVTTTYALNTKTGNFVEDADTGKFADASLSTYYALNTKTGSFIDGTALTTGFVRTTGNQTVSGIKTFASQLKVSSIVSSGSSLSMVDLENSRTTTSAGSASIDWDSRDLLKNTEDSTLNWQSKLLTGGAWNAEGLTLSGYNVITEGNISSFAGTPSSTGFVRTTGLQVVSGTKSFLSTIYAIYIGSDGSSQYIDFVGSQIIADDGLASIWWSLRELLDNGESTTLNWNTRLLTGGNWYAQGLVLSGYNVVTEGNITQFTSGTSYTGIVKTTGNQTISGTKTFADNINVNTIGPAAGGSSISVDSKQLYSLFGVSLDWASYILNDNLENLSINWSGRILTGDWKAKSLSLSGYNVVTDNKTGGFLDSSALTTGYVRTTGNQIVSGNKTFYNNVGFRVENVGIAQAYFSGNSAGKAACAPMRFGSGALIASPESGAVEYDGNALYLTDTRGNRRRIASDNTISVNPGATVHLNAISGTTFKVRLKEDTSIIITGLYDGQEIRVIVTNPKSQSWVVTWTGEYFFCWDGAGSPVQTVGSASGDKTDFYRFSRISSGVFGSYTQNYNWPV